MSFTNATNSKGFFRLTVMQYTVCGTHILILSSYPEQRIREQLLLAQAKEIFLSFSLNAYLFPVARGKFFLMTSVGRKKCNLSLTEPAICTDPSSIRTFLRGNTKGNLRACHRIDIYIFWAPYSSTAPLVGMDCTLGWIILGICLSCTSFLREPQRRNILFSVEIKEQRLR